jgi:hypothetical protein
VRADLLSEGAGQVSSLWTLPGARRVLEKQLSEGSWPRPGHRAYPAVNHRLIETWRQFRLLVEQFGCTQEHPQARLAAEYLLTWQTPEGDIRGILAN